MANNILHELQQTVCEILKSKILNVEFLAENSKTIEYDIKNALGRQGLVSIVLTPNAKYIGAKNGVKLAWEIDQLIIQTVENPTINRARPNAKTAQDVTLEVMDALGENENYGKFCPVSINQTVDENLLVCSATLKALIQPVLEPEQKLLPYLYAEKFDNSYEAEAEEYYQKLDALPASCSTKAVGNLFARSYDWLWNDQVSFVVDRSKTSSTFANIGIASVPEITLEKAESGKWRQFRKYLPGMTTTGVNEHGVAATIHVVHANQEKSWNGNEICILGAVRRVLDYATSAENAVQMLTSKLWTPNKLREMGYDFQLGIADKNKKYIGQDGVFHEVQEIAMTNFRMFDDYGFHDDREEVAVYDPYGTGIERYEILKNATPSKELLSNLRFKEHAYANGFPWPTEFCDEANNLDLNSLDSELRAWATEHATNPRRNAGYWQSVYQTLIDLDSKRMTIWTEEDMDKNVVVQL